MRLWKILSVYAKIYGNTHKLGEIIMKSRHVYIGDSRLPIITAACAGLILFFEFCTVNIMGGRFMFTFRFPLHIAAGTSLFDLIESAVVVCIPLSMLTFTFFFAKKRIRMLIWPIVFHVMSMLVKTAYICVYSGYFTIEDTWLNWVASLLLLFTFTLTVYGRIGKKWLVAVCIVLMLMEIVKFFLPAGPFAFVIGTSVYLSTFLSAILLYIGYAALGLAMKKESAVREKHSRG